MEKAINLNEQVRKINDQLRQHGKAAVQEIKMVNREGKTVGQIKYGYKPQFVFDAVNDVIGAENWRYELIKEEIFDNQAVAEVKLYLKNDGDWFCKGSQKGNSQIVKANVGDAQKGAITNALMKCFSLVSVGADAYKGLLESVYKGRPATTSQQPAAGKSSQASRKPSAPAKTKPTNQQPTTPEPSSNVAPESNATPQNQTDSTGLPQIAGVTYEHRDDGVVVALGKATYDKRDLLKAAGFVFNRIVKQAWAMETGASA